MHDLIHCIYSSAASAHFEESDLPELLSRARVANSARQITGMLAYVNGHFLQVVEGRAGVIDDLLLKLGRDPRHAQMTVMLREPIAERSFEDWSMGFEALLPAEVGALVGENDFFDDGVCLSSLDPGTVKAILTSFRRGGANPSIRISVEQTS